jgi:predicted ribosome quality control (RQC) complex YloA/Tae2 family protein
VQHRLQRTRQEFQRQLDAAAEEEVSKLQTKAELLTTYAYSWKQGDTECVCPDLDTGEEICIPLKPGKSAADEAQATYGRIRKLKRSVDAIMPLLQKIDVKVAYVDELESSIQQLGNSARLDEDTPNVLNTRTLSQDLAIMREIAEELGMNCLDGRGGSSTTFFSTILNRLSVPGTEQSSLSNYKNSKNSKRKKMDKPVREKNKKIQGKSTDGAKKYAQSMTIQSFRPPSVDSAPNVVMYVGRNSKQNDYVTFQLARDHELWFHAQGVPGAHCLLRIDPGVEVSDADMQFAADLAAYFSKARGSGQVPVIWTSPKNLKRVVGGGPGMVHVSKEKVLWGRPSRGEKIVLENDEDNNTLI